MPRIELLRPEQRARLRRLRRRIANRELMRSTRTDIDRKLLCPGVDLPIEAGPCGRLIPRASSRCSRCQRRRWLLNYAFDNAEAASTPRCSRPPRSKTTHPRRRTRPPTPRTPSPLLDELSALGDPPLGWQRLAAPSPPGPLRLGLELPNRYGPSVAPMPGEPSRSGRGRSGTTADDAVRPRKERDDRGNRSTTVERKCTVCA